TKDKVGLQSLTFLMLRLGQNTVFLLLPPAPPVMSASHGWIREESTRKATHFGIPSTELRPTAERLGRKNHSSRRRCADTTTYFPPDSAFPLATCFPSASITSALPM